MRLQEKKDDNFGSVQLNELKLKFDEAIREGEPFSNVKKIYLQIKFLRRYLNSVNIE